MYNDFKSYLFNLFSTIITVIIDLYLCMFLKSIQFKCFQAALGTLMFCVTLSVFSANKEDQIKTTFSTVDGHQPALIVQNTEVKSTPNSSVALDFSNQIAESWGERDQPKNMVVQCINGDVITGVEYSNVTLETVGNSFFSEAVIYFTDSEMNGGLNFLIGSGNENSGTAVFNSNGIVDITDSGNSDVISLIDKKFLIQFYENVDDIRDAVDARFTSGILKIWGINLTPAENCPFISTTNSGGSNLGVSYSLSTIDPLHVGDTVVFDIVVNNSGIDAATAVIIENTLSPNLDFSQFNCDDGTLISSPDSIASVNVNDIAASGTLNCTLEAAIISAGSIESSVNVTTTFDFDLTNNSIIIVLAGASISVPINNTITLILIVFGLLFFTRKFNKN